MFGKGIEWTFCPPLRMEYLPCSDLSSAGVVDEVSAREIMKQLLEALQFMHAHRIAHQDVKPEVSHSHSHARECAGEGLTDPRPNIMIKQRPSRTDGAARSGDGWWIKLVDMGVATYYPEQDNNLLIGGPYGTVPFLSPGILRISVKRPVASAFEQMYKKRTSGPWASPCSSRRPEESVSGKTAAAVRRSGSTTSTWGQPQTSP